MNSINGNNDKQKHSSVDVINLLSIGLFTQLINKYPILNELISNNPNPSKDWDFFMTAAGSGLLLISSEAYNGEHKEIRTRLTELDKDMPRAIDDFIAFMNKGNDSDDEMFAQVGLWVLWNLKKSEPTYEEMKELAPVIGNLLIKITSDCRIANKS